MADNHTTRTEDTRQTEAKSGKPGAVVNAGRFQKGSERAREAGRAGGKKSRRNS